MPPKPEREPIPNEHVLEAYGLEAPEGASVNYHIGYIKNAQGEIEYTRPLPSVRVGARALSGAEIVPITSGPSIRLNRNNRKPIKREHELIAVIPDEQIWYREIEGELYPIHDEPAMQAALMWMRDNQPDYIYANGDTLDFPTVSKYPKDSRHFTARATQASIDRATVWNAEVTEATPNAKRRLRMKGNHDRLSAYILRNAEEVHGLKRGSLTAEHKDDPVLSVASLTRAEELGWEYVSSYPAEYYHSDDLIIIHSNVVRSGGSTAELMSKRYPGVNVVFGHVHRYEVHTTTDWRGNTYMYMTFSSLARNDGYVPAHGSAVDEVTNMPAKRFENWQQGIGVIERYPDGTLIPTFLMIKNGILRHQGKEYDGNEV